jgi:hypothetical protein
MPAPDAGPDGPQPPRAERPHIPEYGVPTTDAGVLPWSWARDRLERALTYWVATVRPDARPHVMPLWGVWLADGFYFEGGLRTRRARNLAANPNAVVTVGGDDEAVIVEGVAALVRGLPAAVEQALVAGFAKYREPFGYTADPANWTSGGLWRMRPRVAFGWSAHGYPADATRWRFDETEGGPGGAELAPGEAPRRP